MAPFDQIQLAIGQGDYAGTPLQLANAYAAIGNGGKLWMPRIVVEARLPDGTVVERNERHLQQRVSLGRGQLGYVVESMRPSSTYPYGTGYLAWLGFGIQVAGKSGTAETGTPTPDAWFPALAPADEPADRRGHGPRPRPAGHRRLRRRSAGPAGLLDLLLRQIVVAAAGDGIDVGQQYAAHRGKPPQPAVPL